MNLPVPVPVATIVLLILSNVFMTFAWYGHLRYKALPLLAAIVIIRVVLSVSLGKEIHGLEERDADAKRHAPPRYE